MRKKSAVQALMDEPIRLPGAPQLIVSRGWAYAWLAKLGYPLQGGLNSVDALVFRRPRAVDAAGAELALTDLTESWAASLIHTMETDL